MMEFGHAMQAWADEHGVEPQQAMLLVGREFTRRLGLGRPHGTGRGGSAIRNRSSIQRRVRWWIAPSPGGERAGVLLRRLRGESSVEGGTVAAKPEAGQVARRRHHLIGLG